MSNISNISWELILPLLVLQIVLAVTALISCLKEENLNGPKWLWIIIILAVNIIGPVLYFVIGRKKQ